jgi:uncharacterized membrane protein
MSTTFAPSSWPAPAPMPKAQSWRFARELRQTREGADTSILQWSMARHGSFAPGQLPAVYLLLCVVALGIGIVFWRLGAPAVLPLAGAELLLLGAAFLVCSRHAGDAETITLAERRLQVEIRHGRLAHDVAFRAEWVRVEPAHGEGSLIEISGQGRSLRVGRYLRPELRMALARELRLALRRDGAPPAPEGLLLRPQR